VSRDTGGPLSIHVMNLVWGSTLKGSSKRFVLLALADRADDEGYCWPSVASICAKTGLCERTVDSVRKGLEGDRLLLQETRWRSRGDRDTNGYWINLDALKRMQRPEPSTRGKHPMEVEDHPTDEPEEVGAHLHPPRGRSMPTVGTEVHPYTSVDPSVGHQILKDSAGAASTRSVDGVPCPREDPDEDRNEARTARILARLEADPEINWFEGCEETMAKDMIWRGRAYQYIKNKILKDRREVPAW
jgi:hypothetical protein